MKREFAIGLCAGLLAVTMAAPAAAQQAEPATAKWTTPPAMTHEAEGRQACLMCHTAGAMDPVPDVPADHEGLANETCLMCHAPDATVQTTTPPVVPHELEGRSACLMCHTAGAMEPVPDVPADHEGRANELCTRCHRPGA